MNKTHNENDLSRAQVSLWSRSPPAELYTRPDEVADDPTLTSEHKRQILASWLSDARAVESQPALRRLDSGDVVDIDTIMRALARLDSPLPAARGDNVRASPRRRRLIARWLSRLGPTDRSNDNDDDPPTAPACIGVPFLSPWLGDSGRPPTVRRLECAIA